MYREAQYSCIKRHLAAELFISNPLHLYDVSVVQAWL
jgi:hypothetical protein